MTLILDPIVLGNAVTLSTTVAQRDPVTRVVIPADDPALQLLITQPDGTVTTLSQPSDVNHDSLGAYHATWVPPIQGHYIWRWQGNGTVAGASEGVFDVSSDFVARVSDIRDVRVLGPMVQRALEGVVKAKQVLTPDQIKDVTADAMAQILLYTGTIFGSPLTILERDPVTMSPSEYRTDRELDLPESTVIAAQAALNYFFHQFKGIKVSESIGDESSTWEYSLSPNLLIAQLGILQDARDKALEAIEAGKHNLEAYTSFLAVRDTQVSRYIEPWVWGYPESYGVGMAGGQIATPLLGDDYFGPYS